MRRYGLVCLVGVVAAVGIVSIWTPLMDADIAARWFTFPNLADPRARAAPRADLRGFWHGAGSTGTAEIMPFAAAVGLFLMLLSRHRHQPVPDDRAASLSRSGRRPPSPSTQAFLLIGTLALLPVILVYTAWSYWVFRGKVRADIGYH